VPELPLTKWFQAFYLVGDAKTGISSLSLMRKLGVNYRTAWLLYNKIMQAMSEREKSYVLRGKVQLDDAYLGGEHNGGKVATFSIAAIADWAQDALARGWEVISDGLACFRAVAEVGCLHRPVVVNGRHPKDLPDFRRINTVISNLKTSFSGTFHALKFEKYADRYLDAFCYRFNRRFYLEEMTGRIF